MATARHLRVHLDGALAHLTPRERLELGALLINEGLAAMAVETASNARTSSPLARGAWEYPDGSLRLMKMSEVAERLGMPLRTAYNAAECGMFPVIRNGNRIYVSVAAFEQWLVDSGRE